MSEDIRKDLDVFLDSIDGETDFWDNPWSHTPEPTQSNAHRKLVVRIASDHMAAILDAVYPDTRKDEVYDALEAQGIVSGIDDQVIVDALRRASKTGRMQPKVRVAQGKSPMGGKRKQRIRFSHFAKENIGQDTLTAHPAFVKIARMMRLPALHLFGNYRGPVVAVSQGACLAEYEKVENETDGFTVLGEVLKPELDREKSEFEPASGVVVMGDGGFYSERYGYLSLVDQEISVVSPIWVSPDRLNVYYFNFDQMGTRVLPTYEDLLHELDHLGVKFGICRETLKQIASGDPNKLQETCILIAEGRKPGKRESLTQFFFEKRNSKIDEEIIDRFSEKSLSQIKAPINPVLPVSEGMVLAVRKKGSSMSLDGMDIYGQTILPDTDEDYDRTVYKAGLHVTERHEADQISFVSDIYGYPVLEGDRIRVLSPIWTTEDWMKAYFVMLPHSSAVRPLQKKNILNLLERANVTFGIDNDVLAKLCQYRSTSTDVQVFLLASGKESVPGSDGQIVFHFDQNQSAGQEQEDGRMDFRERGTVQETMAGDLIAERRLPEPGEPGRNIRGKEIPVQMGNRGLLFVGRNVRVEEMDGLQRYFATASGWPRVIKDTLAVTNRFKTRGDVDFHTGNLDMDGDVEVEGDVKSGFKIQATGSVIVHGSVDRKAEIFSDEHLVIKGGAIGATLRSKLSMEAKFLKETQAYCGTNLLVRNYIEDSKIVAMENAVIQGNGGGERVLCVLGGQVLVAKTLDILGAGSDTGRRTHIAVGVNLPLKKESEKLAKGLDVLKKRISDLERFLGIKVQVENWKTLVREKVGRIKSRAQFHAYLEKVKELEKTLSLQHDIMVRRELLNKKQEDLLREAKLVVRGKVFAGTQLQVGHLMRFLDRDIQTAQIRLDETGRRLKSYSLE